MSATESSQAARLREIRERAALTDQWSSSWLGAYYRKDVPWLLDRIEALEAEWTGLTALYEEERRENARLRAASIQQETP